MMKKHILYSQVEDETFQEFVANCSMGDIIVEWILSCSGNIIRSWIRQKYKKPKSYLNQVILRQAHSLVLNSFYLWAQSNHTAYADVICYFVDVNKQLRILSLAVRYVQGNNSGKNNTGSILPVLKKYSEEKIRLLHYKKCQFQWQMCYWD